MIKLVPFASPTEANALTKIFRLGFQQFKQGADRSTFAAACAAGLLGHGGILLETPAGPG